MQFLEEIEERSISYRYAVMMFLPAAGATVSLLYAVIFYYYLNYPLASLANLVHTIFYLLTFLFIGSGRVRIGRHFITVTFLLQIAEHSLFLFPPEASFQIYFFVGMPLIYMLFSDQQSYSRLIYSGISIALFVLVEFVGSPFEIWQSLDQQQLGFVHNANVVSSLVVLVTTIYLYVHLIERAEDINRRQAISDPLTSLFNRRHFLLLAQQLLSLSQRSSIAHAVMFIDLDNFKQVNDVYGHNVGDRVLQQVASLFSRRVRQSDLVARYGGEEFVMFLADSDEASAINKAEELREAVQLQKLPEGISLSVSVGLVWSRDRDVSLFDLLKRADKAMYEAKRQGKDRVVLAD